MKPTPEQLKEYFETEIRKAIEPFLSMKNTLETKCAIKTSIMGVIHTARANMWIVPDASEKFPIVDINDEKEFEYLSKLVDSHSERQRRDSSEFVCDGSDKIDRELWFASQRLVGLIRKRRKRDPSTVDIVLKHPETFEPWEWK